MIAPSLPVAVGLRPPAARRPLEPSRFVRRLDELSRGNRVALLRDGAEAYPRMLEAIAGARRFILLETYEFSDDIVGQRFARALAARALAGVDVRVLYDSMGSRAVPRDFFGWMRARGVRVRAFHPIRPFLHGFRSRSRNHRKALMIDGDTAFIGGLNLSRDYAPLQDGGGGWRDTEVEIEGPAAADLARRSLEAWPKDRTGPPAPFLSIPRPPEREDGSPVLIVGSSKLRDRFRINRTLRFAFRQAQRRLWIANSYFLPGRALRGELRRACRRGVDVRILVPRTSDVPPALYASQRHFARYLRWGIRIFEWPGPMMHAKTAVIDASWSTVGSYNMDPLSLFLNDELTAVMIDRDFGERLEEMFREDFRACEELSPERWRKRGWLRRAAERLCYAFRLFL